MKRYPHFIVLVVLMGVLFFFTTDAVQAGWNNNCLLTGTWRGTKCQDDNCNNLATDLVVTIVALDPFMNKLSIFARDDYQGIPDFQGDARRTGRDRWEYTLWSTVNPQSCWKARGEFTFDRSDCEITFDEAVTEGSFHGPDAPPNEPSCDDGSRPTWFTGTLLKSEIEEMPPNIP